MNALTMQQAIVKAADKERKARTPGLTERQDDLLRYLIAREKTGEGTPSYEEMVVAMGLASKSNIARLIDGLEERGFIQRVPHRARQLTVTKPWSGPSLSQVASADLVRELRGRGWSVSI